ncbi:MAG: hypothetical protein QW717_04235 [Candidatus Bathyarchaeia archaeon]
METLADGQWHTIEELLEKAKLKSGDFKKVLNFLIDYDFIKTDRKKGKVKLNTICRKLLI